jgi:hypothetical protein
MSKNYYASMVAYYVLSVNRLRELDSNQRPIAYTFSIIANSVDYIIPVFRCASEFRDEGLRASVTDRRATLRKDSLYTFNQQRMLEAWLGIAPYHLNSGFHRIHLVIRPRFLLEAA